MSAEHGGHGESESFVEAIVGFFLAILLIGAVEEEASEVSTAIFVGEMHGRH